MPALHPEQCFWANEYRCVTYLPRAHQQQANRSSCGCDQTQLESSFRLIWLRTCTEPLSWRELSWAELLMIQSWLPCRILCWPATSINLLIAALLSTISGGQRQSMINSTSSRSTTTTTTTTDECRPLTPVLGVQLLVCNATCWLLAGRRWAKVIDRDGCSSCGRLDSLRLSISRRCCCCCTSRLTLKNNSRRDPSAVWS